MKRFGILILTVVMVIGILGGCKDKMTVEDVLSTMSESDLSCPSYDLNKYTQNYWEGNVVYNEAVMPLKNEDGSMSPIKLMYKAAKILEVRDCTLNTLYVEGTDYTLKDGKLSIPENSSINLIPYTEYYPTEDFEGPKLAQSDGTGYILWCEGKNMHQRQIAVSYVHLDSWKGAVPESQGNSLPNTMAKLENKEPINILVYGDSIATGCNSSSETNDAPFAAKWFDMMSESMKIKYGYNDITITNTAVGGTDSKWGWDNVWTLGAYKHPDLAIIAFGMNDQRTPVESYILNINNIISSILAVNKNCEFIVISTILPNEEASGFYGNQLAFRDALLAEKFEFETVVADMTQMYQDILAQKRYCDITGNNINHPNDFLARSYTQVLMKTLERSNVTVEASKK